MTMTAPRAAGSTWVCPACEKAMEQPLRPSEVSHRCRPNAPLVKLKRTR